MASGRTLPARRLRRHRPSPDSRARRRVLQSARHGRAVDQGRQGAITRISDQSAPTYPVSRTSLGRDGDSRALVLITSSASFHAAVLPSGDLTPTARKHRSSFVLARRPRPISRLEGYSDSLSRFQGPPRAQYCRCPRRLNRRLWLTTTGNGECVD